MIPPENFRNYKVAEKFNPYLLDKFENQTTPISVPTCNETSLTTKLEWAGIGGAVVIIILELLKPH